MQKLWKLIDYINIHKHLPRCSDKGYTVFI